MWATSSLWNTASPNSSTSLGILIATRLTICSTTLVNGVLSSLAKKMPQKQHESSISISNMQDVAQPRCLMPEPIILLRVNGNRWQMNSSNLKSMLNNLLHASRLPLLAWTPIANSSFSLFRRCLTSMPCTMLRL